MSIFIIKYVFIKKMFVLYFIFFVRGLLSFNTGYNVTILKGYIENASNWKLSNNEDLPTFINNIDLEIENNPIDSFTSIKLNNI